jgi:hypothetical protein
LFFSAQKCHETIKRDSRYKDSGLSAECSDSLAQQYAPLHVSFQPLRNIPGEVARMEQNVAAAWHTQHLINLPESGRDDHLTGVKAFRDTGQVRAIIAPRQFERVAPKAVGEDDTERPFVRALVSE